jgi:hypothetical protein
MVGADPQAIASPATPTFSSAQTAAEMVEDYWCALTRDVPFSQYSSDPLINQAAADLNKLSDYRAPKVTGKIMPDVIFRGDSPGEANGPYVSQFLWKTIPFGAAMFPTALPHDRGGRRLHDELHGLAQRSERCRNNRDLSEYLHRDFMGKPMCWLLCCC